MKNLLKSKISLVITAIYIFGVSSVYAATNIEGVDDASEMGTSDTTQIKRQDRQMDKNSNKSINKSEMQKNKSQMKTMDSNKDGIVSKDEYMKFHEKNYLDMNPGENGISYKNSMNNKPIGTTTGVSKNGSVDITREDGPINGTTTGTNH